MYKASNMKNVCILGSSGSIGINTLDVIRRHQEKYTAYAISVWNNVDLAVQQALEFKPKYIVVSTAKKASELMVKINKRIDCEVLYGKESLCYIASKADVDIVMAAIVGFAGLEPTLAAVKAGKKILLANKEALVVSGQLFCAEVLRCNATLLPIDSEHNAIYQCYAPQGKDVKSIILTASGGPFLHMSHKEFDNITPEQACKHPKWDMGRKISVDSATMMNKGLEIIEAFWLFPQINSNINIQNIKQKIKVSIHPQSIVHSLVEYIDGSILAQMSNPDMRIPIAYGLAYPERIESGVSPLDINNLYKLEFMHADERKFPCLNLAYNALIEQQSITLNAANEIAVEAFLHNKIKFTQISEHVEQALNSYRYTMPNNLEDILAIDNEVRAIFSIS
jgi:1-deoxy-D-xylulose-5-phosphate reductoisomerase